MNNKGIALPLVIFVVVLFLVAPVAYFLMVNPAPKTHEVKGIAVVKPNEFDNGIGLYINSKYGTWDVLEYLCDEKDTCTNDLMSGKRTGSVSGGIVENYQIRVAPSSEWDTNKYLKVFARSAWGSPERHFEVDLTLDPTLEAEVLELEYEGNVYNVLLVPLESFKNSFSNIAVFGD